MLSVLIFDQDEPEELAAIGQTAMSLGELVSSIGRPIELHLRNEQGVYEDFSGILARIVRPLDGSCQLHLENLQIVD